MIELKEIIAGLFIFSGCFFIIVASIGIVRFPDFYTRVHPAGKADTMGQILILTGLIVYEGLSLISIKLFFIICFILIVNPTATHALVKSAYLSGLKPWTRKKEND
ncbi:MAG: monovalent cation/H(+) antiporter subunit G [Proteobacteria bacterium]|nr:monovalent cation/H(+) antiporter subunit G [Pseudomonadota bacterium]